MGLIYKQLRLTGPKGSRVLRALMDTGASESFIRRREALSLARPFKMPEPTPIELGNGEIQADEALFAYVDLDSVRVHWTFIVVPGLTEQLIVGADFFQRWKIKLDPETEQVILDPKALRLKLVRLGVRVLQSAGCKRGTFVQCGRRKEGSHGRADASG